MPSYRDFASTTAGGSVVPAGRVAGDLLVALVIGSNVAPSLPAVAGYTAVQVYSAGGTGAYLRVYTRVATGTSADEFAFTSSGYDSCAVLAYADAVIDVSGGSAATSTSAVAPAVTTTRMNDIVLRAFGSQFSGEPMTTPPGTTSRAAANANVSYRVADETVAAVGSTGTRAVAVSSGSWVAVTIALRTTNVAPNAPLLVSPVGAVTLDSTSGQRLDWTFSDPDGGDTQSKYDLRYRVVGAASWTDLTGTTSVTHRDVAAGFFADGDYEWQVRTYDAQGLVGPYSASSFFTVATPPPGPSITDPINGATIAAETYTVVWSSPDQDAYQLRVVADDGAGSPDETTVRYDTGTVVSSVARSASVPFPTNGVTEHIQLRVQDGGLWSSPYTTVWVDVSYTPPATPTLAVTAGETSISVAVTHPAPSGGEPTVESQDIYRTELDSTGEPVEATRIRHRDGVDLAPGATFTDHRVAAGTGYAYEAVAFGDNGTSSTSARTG